MENLIALPLSPLLLAQGLYVRRTVQLLPEPPGDRSGVAGAGPPCRLLMLGDSAAAGVGAASQAEGLAGQVVAALAPHRRLTWELRARAGATTKHTLHRLRRRKDEEPFDVVVTSLGVNDVMAGASLGAWMDEQRALVALLRERLGARHLILTGLPPVHAFPALPQPLRWFLGARSRRFDRALEAWAATQPDCDHLRLDMPLDPTLMAADGFHPGPPAYAQWGREVARLVRAR